MPTTAKPSRRRKYAFEAWEAGSPPDSLRADESSITWRADGTLEGWLKPRGCGRLPWRFDLAAFGLTPAGVEVVAVRSDAETVWFTSPPPPAAKKGKARRAR